MVSDSIRLANKFRALMLRFIAEDGATDSDLTAGVDEFPPNKHGISSKCAKDNFLSWPCEQGALAAVSVVVCAVVSFIHFQATYIAVLC